MSRFFYDFPSASSCFVVDQSPIEARRILLRVYLICLDRVFVAALVSTIMVVLFTISMCFWWFVVCCLLFFADQGKSVQSGEHVICCWNHCVVVELFGLSGRYLCLWAWFPDDTRKMVLLASELFPKVKVLVCSAFELFLWG
ncbi:hypothetical protein ES319_D11G289500v1 [Gossypium barbadense]|uniref:Transmembrane protein n=1 Tax=Gossypium barbadense TaxID=3634 RepID=A0A5J5PGA5_GOSBA|nr:hypothetical protein ES319_D11G289500v1 [Gossypium barbadense]